MTAGRPRGPISAASWALSGWRAEQGGDEFASAADAEFVEYGAEGFLNRVGGDVQLFDDLLGRTAPQDEGSNALLGGGESLGVEVQRCHLHRSSTLDDNCCLSAGRPTKPAYVNG